MLVDTHCHLNSLSEAAKEEVIFSCGAGYRFIDSSIDLGSARASTALSDSNSFVYSSVGFHPLCGKDFSPSVVKDYEKLIDENEKVIAIGEIGLDFKAPISFGEQEDILSAFIQLAKSRNLPVILHNRWNDEKILDILDKFFTAYKKVVFHCFSYSKEFLEKIIERGGFVSFSLNILRKKEDIISSLKSCPLDRLLLETDSPYMRVKGEPSTPLDIVKTYSAAAEAKGISRDELEQVVFSNIRKLFPGLGER